MNFSTRKSKSDLVIQISFEKLLCAFEFLDLVLEATKAVAFAVEDHEVDVSTRVFQGCHETTALIDRHHGIIGAVEDEQGNPRQGVDVSLR